MYDFSNQFSDFTRALGNNQVLGCWLTCDRESFNIGSSLKSRLRNTDAKSKPSLLNLANGAGV
jgi:hypothetical protein